jgi:hypothetical protein
VSALPPRAKQYVKETLTSLSIKLMHFHNNIINDMLCFASDARYAQFEGLTRKCYQRLQHISRELIQEFLDFPCPAPASDLVSSVESGREDATVVIVPPSVDSGDNPSLEEEIAMAVLTEQQHHESDHQSA